LLKIDDIIPNKIAISTDEPLDDTIFRKTPRKQDLTDTWWFVTQTYRLRKRRILFIAYRRRTWLEISAQILKHPTNELRSCKCFEFLLEFLLFLKARSISMIFISCHFLASFIGVCPLLSTRLCLIWGFLRKNLVKLLFPVKIARWSGVRPQTSAMFTSNPNNIIKK